jgi:hypothetical protein
MSTEKTDTSSREWGDILADVGVGALRGYAQNGLRGAIAGGIIGGIEGDKQAENEALAKENARLRNQALKQQIEFDKNREARAAAADQRAGQAHAQHIKQANVNYENSQMNLYLQQGTVYGNEFDALMKKVIDKQGLDFESQNMLLNSSPYKEARDMWIAFKSYDNNPDSAVALLKNVGWNVETDKDGKTWLYQTTADGKQKRLEFNDATISALRDSVNKNFMDFYGTSVAVGTEASTLYQAAIKNILNTPEVKSIYGDNLLDAGREYKAFLKNSKFTSEEIAAHVMNRTLQSAIADRRLTQKEMSLLAPQFELALRNFGGEITLLHIDQKPGANFSSFDGSVDKALVKLKDGRTITLDTLARELNERDIVWHRWNDTMRAKAVARETAMLEKANKEMLLRNRVLDNQKKNRNAGGVGSSDAAGETPRDQTVEMGLAVGNDFIKRYNLINLAPHKIGANGEHIEPNDAEKEIYVAKLGAAELFAQKAYKETGFYFQAEKAFYRVWDKKLVDRKGNTYMLSNEDGTTNMFLTNDMKKPVFWFSSPEARKADLKKVQELEKTDPKAAERIHTEMAISHGDLKITREPRRLQLRPLRPHPLPESIINPPGEYDRRKRNLETEKMLKDPKKYRENMRKMHEKYNSGWV